MARDIRIRNTTGQPTVSVIEMSGIYPPHQAIKDGQMTWQSNVGEIVGYNHYGVKDGVDQIYLKTKDGVVYSNCPEGLADGRWEEERDKERLKSMSTQQREQVSRNSKFEQKNTHASILNEAKQRFAFDMSGSHSIRPQQGIADISLSNLKYINRTTGRGFAFPPDYVEALTSLHKAWQASPHPAFQNLNPQTPLAAVLHDNPQRHQILDSFNRAIQRETNHPGLSYGDWNLLTNTAQITVEDLQRGLCVQLRDQDKNVLQTIDGLRSFSFDRQSGDITMASRNMDFYGTEASYQSHSMDRHR